MVAAVEDTEEPTQISQPEDTSRTQSETPKMSSTGKVLSLKAPEPLPAEGVTTISFKVWKNQAIAWVEQETTHFLFLEGGLYSSWLARSDGQRIAALHQEDPDRKRIEDKRTAAIAAADSPMMLFRKMRYPRPKRRGC